MIMIDINIVKDVSALSTIQDKVIYKLLDKFTYSICEAVEEAVIADDDVVVLDIGIGELTIKLSEDGIRYKFIPSQKLEEGVKNTFIYRQNLLEKTLEESLVNRLTNTYKDLL